MWGDYAEVAELKPHQIRYWLTPLDESSLRTKSTTLPARFIRRQQHGFAGERTVCTDEMGFKRLCAKRQTPRPGKVQRRV